MKRSSPVSRITLVVVLVSIAVLGAALWFVFRGRGPRVAEEVSDAFVEEFYIGVAALDVDENDRARRIFERLSEASPREPAVWANLALSYLRLNEFPSARQAAARAAELAPDDPRVAVVQARIEEMQGELDRAIEVLRRVPTKDPAALYLLAQLIERTRRSDSASQQLELMNEILRRRPDNLVARFKQARLAAGLDDALLRQAISHLAEYRETWPAGAEDELAAAQAAIRAGETREALTHLTRLENLNKSQPLYLASLTALGVSGNALGQPIREFLALPMPPPAVAEADRALPFEIQPPPKPAEGSDLLLAVPFAGKPEVSLVSLAQGTVRIGDSAPLPFPGPTAGDGVGAASLCIADLNGDFREDLLLAGEEGCAVYLQNESGGFDAWTPPEDETSLFGQPSDGIWVLDVEADGDLDLVISHSDGRPQLLRNNGDMTFAAGASLEDLPPLCGLLWLDLAGDGDADVAVLDQQGHVLYYANERAGRFLPAVRPFGETRAVAMAAGDVTRDGTFSLVSLDADGTIRRASMRADDGSWETAELAHWTDKPDLDAAFQSRRARLFLADLDNNGAVDLVASAGTETAIWLGGRETGFERLAGAPVLSALSIADVDGNGYLDLVGMGREGPGIALNRSQAGYRWQQIETRAVQSAGDHRFNSYGLGGRIELRAGRLLQAAPIDATRTHFGLGRYQRAGVARIIWPNGTVQIEFDLEPDRVVTAQQRLKGSCPFVFAYDGSGLRFVKDFIWRSPLGLRINAQDTAGVTQTEDWIKVPGEMLAGQDGMYELRITAELWETHFFDWLSLMTVDHPQEVDVWVDERFVAASSPPLGVIASTPPRPLAEVYDDHGRLVVELTRAIDGRYVDSFALGKFQGVAEEHWVEFQLDRDLPTNEPLFLLGQGWVYPTDSSLNVAMAQGNFPRPFGLILDVEEADGSWRPVSPDLGFPAGKNKTVLLPLPSDLLSQGKRRFRLRTNLEVYWDYLGWVAAKDTPLDSTRLQPSVALLRYRGFSQLSSLDRRKPDLPQYDRLLGSGQRWRDLEGYYTRFGDVRELLQAVDDRYCVMNAGDEIVLRFDAPASPEPGWKRDFVLIGDGWVKDGDYNTSFSKTVRPLPTHDSPDYSQPPGALADDPVYQKHPEDWREFHTRYVRPSEFARGIWPPRDAQ